MVFGSMAVMPLEDFPHSDLAFGPNALEWRHHAKEGLMWRLATLEDLPALHEHWDRMDARIQAVQPGAPKQDRPNLFQMPVVLTLVAVDQDSGRIEGAIYGETVVDWTMIGASRRVARTIDELHPTLFMFLFPRTIRVTRMLVPLRIEKHMAKLLPRMRNITQSFAQFVCNIRS